MCLLMEYREFIEFVKQGFPPPKGSGMQCGVMDTKAAIQEPGATGPLMRNMCVAIEKLFRDLLVTGKTGM